jgi:hypothetical protein
LNDPTAKVGESAVHFSIANLHSHLDASSSEALEVRVPGFESKEHGDSIESAKPKKLDIPIGLSEPTGTSRFFVVGSGDKIVMFQADFAIQNEESRVSSYGILTQRYNRR